MTRQPHERYLIFKTTGAPYGVATVDVKTQNTDFSFDIDFFPDKHGHDMSTHLCALCQISGETSIFLSIVLFFVVSIWAGPGSIRVQSFRTDHALEAVAKALLETMSPPVKIYFGEVSSSAPFT
jgi:hypothetical protein